MNIGLQAINSKPITLSRTTAFNALKQGLKGVFVAWLFCLPLLTYAQTLSVKTDRQTIEMGDVINLFIESDFQTQGKQLNLERLNDQFDILGKQQSNQLEMINGQVTSRTLWQIQLLAKQQGELIIPPLTLDQAVSEPYKITVLPIKQTTSANLKRYFLQSSLNKSTAHVQEEVLYSLRLYFLGSAAGNIRPPQFNNALTVPLKEQSVFAKNLNGKRYTVYEWVYAIYPQQSGELTIPGPVFTGLIHDQGRQKGVHETAKVQILQVLPEVADFNKQSNNAWLPAKSLQYQQQWQTPLTEIHVGDSLNRTLTLQVTGLKASQLPTISTANVPGLKIYADQPMSQETLIEDGVRSQIQVKQAILPTQAGKLKLPAQSITWWNTQTQQIETTTLPEQTLQVLPALANTTKNALLAPDQSTQFIAKKAAESQPNENLAVVSRETINEWQWVSLSLFILWLATLWLWRKTHKQLKPSHSTTSLAPDLPNGDLTPSNTHSALCSLNKQGELPQDATQFYDRLRKVLAEDYGIKRFEEITQSDLKAAIGQLEAHLFHPVYQSSLDSATLKTICHGLSQLASNKANGESNNHTQSDTTLAKLYSR